MTVSTKNVLSFEVEDRFHDGYNQGSNKDSRSRILPILIHLLDTLDNQKASATFFFLGCVAERFPEIVALVDSRGHEVASHGYSSTHIEIMPADKLVENLISSRELLERVLDKRVFGIKPHLKHSRHIDPLVVESAARAGYRYLSGTLPENSIRSSEPPFSKRTENDLTIDIIPQCVWEKWRIKIEFGERLRLFPSWFIQKAIERLNRNKQKAIINFKLWELDKHQVRPPGSDFTNYARYGNLNLTEEKLIRLLENFEFTSFADSLGLVPESKIDTLEDMDERPLS